MKHIKLLWITKKLMHNTLWASAHTPLTPLTLQKLKTIKELQWHHLKT